MIADPDLRPRDWLGTPSLDWSDGHAPRSGAFGDIYYAPGDGLAESRFVFVDGVGGAGLFQGKAHTVIAETGFGTGLNFLAAWDCWIRAGRPGRLTFISVEGYPLSTGEMERAHAPLAELAPLSAKLASALPPRVPGFHLVEPDAGLHLLLLYGEAVEMLRQLEARVDAWFLDGFAPSRNPELWSEDVLREVGRLSRPGARLATFTAAGAVRRGLAAAGFDVRKAQGFAGKRERILAEMPGNRAPEPAIPDPVIIGDGIAGRLLARALHRRNIPARLLSPVISDSGSGSRNPVPLVTPRLTLHPGAYGRLQDQAYLAATRCYDALDAKESPVWLSPRGSTAIAREAADAERQVRQLAFANWPAEVGERLDADRIGGLPSPHGGVRFPAAGGLDRAALFSNLEQQSGAAEKWPGLSILRGPDGWQVVSVDRRVVETDYLVIAAGAMTPDFLPMLAPVANRVRGQVEFAAPGSGPALTFGSYLTPDITLPDGRLVRAFGATFNREAEFGNGRAVLLASESGTNLAQLRERMPGFDPEMLDGQGWAGWRLTTRDRMPYCGKVDDGRYVLAGLGSRGFTHAPLMADHLAALIAGDPSPLRRDVADALLPRRFCPAE
jgi:tRNA 5-methylaminomethyl-2-thiouridine biosynthesis bifunctional protein